MKGGCFRSPFRPKKETNWQPASSRRILGYGVGPRQNWTAVFPNSHFMSGSYVAFLKDGRTLVSAGSDRVAKIWAALPTAGR